MKKKRKSLLKTFVLVLGALEVFNKMIDSSSIVNANTRTGGKYYHWKYGDIYYHVYGEKGNKPLLLIHDLTVDSSSYEWHQLAKKLTDTYRIYTIDLIGCGKSDKPGITYTNYFYVQMITDFVAEVIGQKTNVAATGLSNSFVLFANAMNHDLFDKIMMVSPTDLTTLKKTPDKHSHFIVRAFEFPIIGKALYYAFTSHMNTEYYLTETCFFDSFHMEPSVVKAYYDASHAGNGNGKYLLASQFGNYLYADVSRALRTADNRIVLVTGTQNKKADALIREYMALQPRLVIEPVDEAKLLPQLENEGKMLELLYTF